MIRVFLFGGYRNRNPLSYDAIRVRLYDRVELVDAPSDAQLMVISHYSDFELFGQQIFDILASTPKLRLVLLSEEPFWDSIWMPNPLLRHQSCRAKQGEISYIVLNHITSKIYNYDKIPYFLLTDPRYITHYRPMLVRNAGMSASVWHDHFSSVQEDAVFLNIRRTGQIFSPTFPDAGMWALSVYRSEFAARCIGKSVVRQGKGWDAGPPRQDLKDWHRDKLDRFDQCCRYMSAFENTHHSDYVSEKIFDAFAVGAVPLYFAAPKHSVHKILGSEGWLNLFSDHKSVPIFDAEQPVDQRFCDGYARSQERLAKLFDDRSAIEQEYDRLCSTLVNELSEVIHESNREGHH